MSELNDLISNCMETHRLALLAKKQINRLEELSTVKRAQEIIASLENTMCNRDNEIAELENHLRIGEGYTNMRVKRIRRMSERIKKLEGDLAEEELPALWEAFHDRNMRIEELETQKVIADAHNDDALAFIKQKGLFDDYYEGAGDWEEQQR